eukprot:12124197-Prorocentrum_lima.AAC.1
MPPHALRSPGSQGQNYRQAAVRVASVLESLLRPLRVELQGSQEASEYYSDQEPWYRWES